MHTAGNGWRWFGRARAGGLALVAAAAVVPWGAAAAQASDNPGTLRLTVTKVVAGPRAPITPWPRVDFGCLTSNG